MSSDKTDKAKPDQREPQKREGYVPEEAKKVLYNNISKRCISIIRDKEDDSKLIRLKPKFIYDNEKHYGYFDFTIEMRRTALGQSDVVGSKDKVPVETYKEFTLTEPDNKLVFLVVELLIIAYDFQDLVINGEPLKDD